MPIRKRGHISENANPLLRNELTRNLFLWLDRKRSDAEHQRKVAKVLLDVGADMPESTSTASAPGDNRRLRGVPVVGVKGGMGGAIAGTRPGDSLKRERE